jgi:hypothetical protein
MKRVWMMLFAWPLVSSAGPLSEIWTVENVVRDLRPTPEANEPRRTPAEFLRYQKAQGFIDGVKDATEGTFWCYDRITAPVELDSELYHQLKQLPAPQQKQRAGAVILDLLKFKYPCIKDHRS